MILEQEQLNFAGKHLLYQFPGIDAHRCLILYWIVLIDAFNDKMTVYCSCYLLNELVWKLPGLNVRAQIIDFLVCEDP